MKTVSDPAHSLTGGFAAIREELQLPDAFPPEVLTAADAAAKRPPSDHVDRTYRRFVTLDPETSTDLDQAFAIERSGADLLLHYAIADVAWFVDDGGVIDAEAWRRGETLYLPDGKANLYPPVLSERAASLLPDGPRPAVVFTVRVAPDGGVRLDGVERATVRSAAKLGYASVTDADLPAGFVQLADRIQAAEAARGAARVDPPEQELEAVAPGRFELRFRPRLLSEDRNAALSLATNLAVAQLLHSHRTGLFRVMAGPEERTVDRLRHIAGAYGLNWPATMPLPAFEVTLDAADPRQAAFMLAVRRAGSGARYVPFAGGPAPWHAAMAATYAHATAPLRRLADRYVVMAALAIGRGEAVPATITDAFNRLPAVMARADTLSGKVTRAAIDLAEAVMLHGREGESFAAVVTECDDRGARIQLCDLPITSRVDSVGLLPGQPLTVTLTTADPARRVIAFTRRA